MTFHPSFSFLLVLTSLIGSIFLSQCSDVRYLLSYDEIESAYNSFEPEYVPELERVVLQENRALKASALYYLGLYYRDYVETDEEDLSTQEIQAKEGIKFFFQEYYEQTSDFNLKNLILMALISYDTALDQSDGFGKKVLTEEAIELIIRELEATNRREVKFYLLKLIRNESDLGRLRFNENSDENLKEKMEELLKVNLYDEDPQMFKESLRAYLSIISETEEKIKKLEELSSSLSLDNYRRFVLNYFLEISRKQIES